MSDVPDYEKLPSDPSLTHGEIEAEAWVQFAACAVADGYTVESAAAKADAMMEEFRRRFIKE